MTMKKSWQPCAGRGPVRTSAAVAKEIEEGRNKLNCGVWKLVWEVQKLNRTDRDPNALLGTEERGRYYLL